LIEVFAAAAIFTSCAWGYAELRLGRPARIGLGIASLLFVALCAAGVRDLQYRHFAFRVTHALREVSSLVARGRVDGIHAPIERFSSAVQHDPSLAAAVELVADLERYEDQARQEERRAIEALSDHSYDHARVYFEPWHIEHVVAETPEGIKKRPTVDATFHGWSTASSIAARMAIGTREDSTQLERSRDVRLVVEFMREGELIRTVYATNAMLYDERGPIHAIDQEFKDMFTPLEAPSRPLPKSALR
jgi:hypothetical protein